MVGNSLDAAVTLCDRATVGQPESRKTWNGDCTSCEGARTLRAMAVLQAAEKSVRVQKLAQTTNLRDLNSALLAWLGTTNDAERRSGATGRYTLVRDLNHDVWVCAIGDATGYGRTVADAVLACSEPHNA